MRPVRLANSGCVPIGRDNSRVELRQLYICECFNLLAGLGQQQLRYRRYHADPDEAARRGSAAEHRNRRCRAPRKQTFAYIFTFVPATGQQTAQMRDTLEDANLTVVPGGMGTAQRSSRDAIENGQTVQERNPQR